MAGIKISALPAVGSALTTDYFPVVQGGVTSRETLLQVQTLFGFSSGILALVNGGTGAALVAANGAIPYSTASTLALLAPGTSGQLFRSGGAGAPTWTTATFPATAGTSGNVLVSGGTNWSSSSTTGITALGAQAQALNMGTHLINNVVDPVSAQDAATKNYVDQTALNGTSVYAASAATLGTVTQSGSGVGATLTNAGAQAAFLLDGVNPPVGVNVLIKNTATGMTAANEGIYTVTSVGSGATNWVLTRATGYDTTTEINNTGLIIVQNGSTLSGSAWYNTTTIATVDTTSFSFTQFGASFPLSLANGGTGAALTASNGGIFYSGASAGAILGGTATAGLALLSGASTTPSWSTAPPITKVNIQVITATGSSTYTPTAGSKYFIVEGVGGGGGSGGSAGVGATSSGATGGGGSGGYFRRAFTTANMGASAAVVIGAGGAGGSAGNNAGSDGANTTFTPAGTGGVLTGNGGAHSAGAAAVTTQVLNNGGVGGNASGGDVNIKGGDGLVGVVINGATAVAIGGCGGGNLLGSPSFLVNNAAGNANNNYGTGGSGVIGNLANVAGNVGANGVVIVTEYISV